MKLKISTMHLQQFRTIQVQIRICARRCVCFLRNKIHNKLRANGNLSKANYANSSARDSLLSKINACVQTLWMLTATRELPRIFNFCKNTTLQ